MTAAGGLLDDLLFLAPARVRHAELEHEPVELRLGQGIGAFLLDRILGREDEERIGKSIGRARCRDVVLLHCLKESGLGLGGCAVDLVGQDDIGEHGTRHEPEGALASCQVFLDDLSAGDVARHQVRSELHPVEAQLQCLGDCLDHEGLGKPWNTDEEGVPAGEDGRQDAINDRVLTDDALGNLGPE